MIQSMTGYGKATSEYNGKKISVELKSLNSKQAADLSMRISPLYRERELTMRNIILQEMERGKIDFALYVENTGAQSSATINKNVFESYYWQMKRIAEELHIPLPTDWFSTLMQIPDVLRNEEKSSDEQEWSTVFATIAQAISHLTEFRIQEGQALYDVFDAKLNRIAELVDEIEQYEGERIHKIRTRIDENLQKLADSAKVDFNSNRVEQEMIFYIEKMDINEEKVRLRNHLNYFRETMNEEKSAGKKLGFIAQEIGREINTMGSKSNHSEMQIIVVQMKDELEQIKEQVLNVL